MKKPVAHLIWALVAPCLWPLLCLGQTQTPEGLYAEVTTTQGLIVIQLEFEKTPMTVANFVGLAEGTLKNKAFPLGTPYFEGTRWHRVVPGHVIQCGIPKSDKAQDPGYLFPNEIRLPELNHGRPGMVNMANDGPHTNGSEWCIMLGDRSYLDGDYTVFGHVTRGMEVVLKITQEDVVQHVKIVRVGKAAEAFRPTTESFTAMVETAKVRVKQAEEEKRRKEAGLIAAKWPNAASDANGVKAIIVREGTGEPPKPGSRLKIAYSGATLYGKSFVSTLDGTPYWGASPEPFLFEPGKTHLNPGFDAAATHMKKGEKRTLIVPPDQAYATGGFYAKERKGERRFVISPNTVVVYEIELIDIQ
jgi:cyclophilin family peptidyl-prolyl cis-trans isomerase